MFLSDKIKFNLIYTISSINHAISVDFSIMTNADIDEMIDDILLMIFSSIQYSLDRVTLA